MNSTLVLNECASRKHLSYFTLILIRKIILHYAKVQESVTRIKRDHTVPSHGPYITSSWNSFI
jgi:hypothetical protein